MNIILYASFLRLLMAIFDETDIQSSLAAHLPPSEIPKLRELNRASRAMYKYSFKQKDFERSIADLTVFDHPMLFKSYINSAYFDRESNGERVLVHACRLGKAPAFKLLVSKGVDATIHGEYCFRTAVFNGYTDILEFMFENGLADDPVGALQGAAVLGNASLLSSLLDRVFQIDINEVNHALRILFRYGYLDAIKKFLDAEKMKNFQLREMVFYSAIEFYKPAMLSFVFSFVDNIEYLHSFTDIARMNPKIEVLKFLLLDIRLKGDERSSIINLVLLFASEKGDYSLMEKYLNDAGAIEREIVNSCLEVACDNGELRIIKLLEDWKFIDKARTYYFVDSLKFASRALKTAVVMNRVDIVHHFLAKSMDCSVFLKSLTFSIEKGSFDVFSLLFSECQCDKKSYEVIDAAIKAEKDDIVQHLLEVDEESRRLGLIVAVENSSNRFIKQFLSDRRIKVDDEADNYILRAVKTSNFEGFRLLMADGRFDAYRNENECLKEAIKRENQQMVKFLLHNYPKDQTLNANEIFELADKLKNKSIANEVLECERIIINIDTNELTFE